MATIVTRAGKGAPLTHTEVDANFTNLNSDKVETSAISAFGATLIDDADAAAARTTLGLGTAATTASTDYATAAQGALADSATQPGDNVSTLTNDAGYVSSLSDLGVTATAAELNVLDGITATVTELNYVDGVTSAIQTQLDGKVDQTSSTGSAEIPAGTTAQRDGSPQAGYFRFNSTDGAFEGYDGTAWGSIGGGAGLFKGENGEVGSSAGDIFRINEQTLNTNVTIDADENASATGPLTVASGVTLTVTSGGNLSIV